MTNVEVVGLTCEYMTNPLGIGTRTPRLSWKLRSDCEPSERGCMRNSITLSRTGEE